MVLIQIVGVPGAGKSFFLKLMKLNPVKDFNYYEFRDLYDNYKNENNLSKKIISLYTINDLIRKSNNSVIASHFVYFIDGNFENNIYFHEYSRSKGYIFINASTEEIKNQILTDIKNNKRNGEHYTDKKNNRQYYKNNEDLVELIEKYRILNLKYLGLICSKLNIQPLKINNKRGAEIENLNIINNYLNNVI